MKVFSRHKTIYIRLMKFYKFTEKSFVNRDLSVQLFIAGLKIGLIKLT
jgi:hypothetical protein